MKLISIIALSGVKKSYCTFYIQILSIAIYTVLYTFMRTENDRYGP